MRDYELVLIVKPEITDENLPAALEKINKFITDRSGAVTETKQWGRRRLAYAIKGAVEGNYVLTRLKAEPKLVPALHANLKVSEDVLQHLLVRVEAPSPKSA